MTDRRPELGAVLLFAFGVGFPLALSHPRVHAAFQALNNRFGRDESVQAILDFAPYFRTYMLVVIVATAVVAGAALVLSAAAVAHAALTRRSASVFISYHHDLAATAEALALSLERARCRALWIPFASAAEHDALLDRIYGGIRQCDFLVCLPGRQPSFVEAEVAAAIGLRKPIIIVLPSDHAGAPNTSHKSYPALVLEKLDVQQFAPLVSFVRYLHGDLRATMELLALNTEPPNWMPSSGAILALGFWSLFAGFWAMIALLAADLITFRVFDLSSVAERLLAALWFGGFYAVGTVALVTIPLSLVGRLSAIGYRLEAAHVVRRRVKQGRYSYELLRPLLTKTRAMKPMLEPFFTAPPIAHHEQLGLSSTTSAPS